MVCKLTTASEAMTLEFHQCFLHPSCLYTDPKELNEKKQFLLSGL